MKHTHDTPPAGSLFAPRPAEPKTQTQVILEALQSGKRLTPLDALNLCGCMRLAARIHELRQAGHKIKDDGEKQHAVYYMEKQA